MPDLFELWIGDARALTFAEWHEAWTEECEQRAQELKRAERERERRRMVYMQPPHPHIPIGAAITMPQELLRGMANMTPTQQAEWQRAQMMAPNKGALVGMLGGILGMGPWPGPR